jgi:hypothetical protein
VGRGRRKEERGNGYETGSNMVQGVGVER